MTWLDYLVSIRPSSILYFLAGLPTAALVVYRLYHKPPSMWDVLFPAARTFAALVAAENLVLFTVLQRVPAQLSSLDRAIFFLAALLVVASASYSLTRGTPLGERFRRPYMRLMGVDAVTPQNPMATEFDTLRALRKTFAGRKNFDVDDQTRFLGCHAGIGAMLDRCNLSPMQKQRILSLADEVKAFFEAPITSSEDASKANARIEMLMRAIDATFREIADEHKPRQKSPDAYV